MLICATNKTIDNLNNNIKNNKTQMLTCSVLFRNKVCFFPKLAPNYAVGKILISHSISTKKKNSLQIYNKNKKKTNHVVQI